MGNAIVPFNKRKSNYEKAKRDASYAVVSEHVILMCREYAKSNSITKAARAGGFTYEEASRLLCEPKVIECLEEEIKARSSSAKVSKEILVNRLNIISEKITEAMEDDDIPAGKASVMLKTLGAYTEMIAKMKGYYKEEEVESRSEEKQRLLDSRKNIFWADQMYGSKFEQSTDTVDQDIEDYAEVSVIQPDNE